MPVTWPCPGPAGLAEDYAVAFDRARSIRVLIVPPLFEEMNRTRRLLVETQRQLDALGLALRIGRHADRGAGFDAS